MMAGRGGGSVQFNPPAAILKDDTSAEASSDESSPQEDGYQASLSTVRRKLDPTADGKLASVFTSVANFFAKKEPEHEFEGVHVCGHIAYSFSTQSHCFFSGNDHDGSGNVYKQR
jgi:hypothetical protein